MKEKQVIYEHFVGRTETLQQYATIYNVQDILWYTISNLLGLFLVFSIRANFMFTYIVFTSSKLIHIPVIKTVIHLMVCSLIF
jgi:hypothetical protein